MSITISVTLTDKEFEERYVFLIQQAKSQANGSSFTVMSLFPDWNKIPKGTKLSLGRNFYHLVKRGEVDGVIPDGKNSSNIQLQLLSSLIYVTLLTIG